MSSWRDIASQQAQEDLDGLVGVAIGDVFQVDLEHLDGVTSAGSGLVSPR